MEGMRWLTEVVGGRTSWEEEAATTLLLEAGGRTWREFSVQWNISYIHNMYVVTLSYHYWCVCVCVCVF